MIGINNNRVIQESCEHKILICSNSGSLGIFVARFRKLRYIHRIIRRTFRNSRLISLKAYQIPAKRLTQCLSTELNYYFSGLDVQFYANFHETLQIPWAFDTPSSRVISSTVHICLATFSTALCILQLFASSCFLWAHLCNERYAC